VLEALKLAPLISFVRQLKKF